MSGEDEQADRRPDGAATEHDAELTEQRFLEEVMRSIIYCPLLRCCSDCDGIRRAWVVHHEMSRIVLHI